MATVDAVGESFQHHHHHRPPRPPPQDDDYDPKSGFCSRTGVYRSLHKLGPDDHATASNHNLDAATFVLSKLPPEHVSESKAALIDSATGSSITYARLRRSALALAAALHHGLGVRRGDVVLLLSPPSSILYPALCLAILASGAVVAPADPLAASADDVAKHVRRSGAKLAVSAPEEAHKVEATGIPVLITNTAAGSGSNANSNGQHLSIEELIEGGEVSEAPSAAEMGITQSDTAVVLYSSSSPSLQILTHGNIIAASMMVRWGVEKESSAGEDATLGFHPVSPGLALLELGLLCTGLTTVVMPEGPDFGAMMKAVEKHRISDILAAPPAALSAMNSYCGGGRNFNLSRIRRVSSNVKLGPAVGEEFRRKFPWVTLMEGCNGMILTTVSALDRVGSAGKLMPLVEGRVVDLNGGGAAGPGAVGELWLRGPTVRLLMKTGAAEDDVDKDGWLRTGDLAYFDKDGFLYIVEGVRELINHNGHQVDPYKKIEKVAFVNNIPRPAAGKIFISNLGAQRQEAIPAKL